MSEIHEHTLRVATPTMHIPRLVMPIVAVVTMIAACTSIEQPEFRPIGNSPPIPMAASAELQEAVAEAIGAPPPSTGLEKIDFSDPVAAGKIVVERNACGACHSIDGTKLVGPTWKGLFGSSESMTDGSSFVVDEVYIAESIRNPAAKIVAGFDNAMTVFDFLSDDEVNALVAYIKSLQ